MKLNTLLRHLICVFSYHSHVDVWIRAVVSQTFYSPRTPSDIQPPAAYLPLRT